MTAPRRIKFVRQGRPPVCCVTGCGKSGTVWWHRLRWCGAHLPQAAHKELGGADMKEVVL